MNQQKINLFVDRFESAGQRFTAAVGLLCTALLCLLTVGGLTAVARAASADGEVVKRVLSVGEGVSLLGADRWQPWKAGFEREGELFVCDNAGDAKSQRGVGQTVAINQKTPRPIVATAESKAENVDGGADNNYALYLDLTFTDGTNLWGQAAAFTTGTHDWQQRQVVILPEKPVKSVALWLLLRSHAGKALFRNPQLHEVAAAAGTALFDGAPVTVLGHAPLQVRDVAKGGDFRRFDRQAVGCVVQADQRRAGDATWHDVSVEAADGKDHALTLLYSVKVPFAAGQLTWWSDPRHSETIASGREYMNAAQFRAGANGRLSRYPLGVIATPQGGRALGIDLDCPAFFRIGYNAATEELFLAYDIALTREQPRALLRFCEFVVPAADSFRAALARYYELLPDAFRCRTPQQGVWMPFAKVSAVKNWQDFGFRFKEGDNETSWDDQHGLLTFRYTEPLTWWMAMPRDLPRTLEAAVAEARRLADEKNDPRAKALFTSGYHDAQGKFAARLLDTPWCNGAVWSMNSMPGLADRPTDFSLKWNAELREKLYGAGRKGDLDGEYIDSSEGYVTDELDFRRDHFAAARTPLCFSLDEHRPAIFRGLIAFEYVRAIADDMHGRGKLMMANGAPDRLCWLIPLVDVGGTETDWHRGGRWQPMSDAEMLYRRAMCKGKPFCFLMNTRFEDFSHELVEKYMKRCLAYGMFPGFFSHNASQGHYFTRPELYERDRPLFLKYVPLCRQVAEAGWQPLTSARCETDGVYVERYGDRLWTVFNDSLQRRTVIVARHAPAPETCRDLVSGRTVPVSEGTATLTLDGGDVAVLEW